MSPNVKEHGAVGDLTVSYGLPGKPGYSYPDPSIISTFTSPAVTANTVESLNTRGLLVGAAYESGDATRGIWGLYGSYDYISPQVFRVSTMALSLGTTWQTWLSQDHRTSGDRPGGPGYGAAGSIQRRRIGIITMASARRRFSPPSHPGRSGHDRFHGA